MLSNSYSKNEKYIFVSYSHEDKNLVLDIIKKLTDDGYRLWYDSGIHPGAEWAKVIASQIKHCHYFLSFISNHYLESDNCLEELDYARRMKKKRLVVYLAEVTLPDDLDMRLGHIQSIYKYQYKTDEPFYNQLYSSDDIDSCKKPPQEPDPPEPTDQVTPKPPDRDPPPDTRKPLPVFLLSTILLLVACPLRVGVIAFSLLLTVMAITIFAQPICSTYEFRIWSSICFWPANILAARSLFERVLEFVDAGIPIYLWEIFFILIFAAVYYISKWLKKVKPKANIILSSISVLLILVLIIGAAVATIQNKGPNGKFQALPTRYEDDYLGFGFKIPDGWDYRDDNGCYEYSEAYKSKLLDIASLNIWDHEDPAKRISNTRIYLKMIAENEEKNSRVSVMYLYAKESDDLIGYELSRYSVFLKDFIENSIGETVSSELSLRIGAQELNGNIYITDDFCASVLYARKDEYIAIFILETPDRTSTDDLMGSFYSPAIQRTIEMLWQPFPNTRKTSELQSYPSK